MPDAAQKPVLFLAFASVASDVGYLPSLAEEAFSLRSILEVAEARGQCQVVVRENLTLDGLLDVFQDARYRGRIALLHYAGHADDYALLLEQSAGVPLFAEAGGLTAFLAGKPELKLVFLNGCATAGHVAGLHGAGIPAVIATTTGAVHDELASHFAQRFYKGLAGGASLAAAFAEAQAAAQIAGGQQVDSPWQLFTAGEPARQWTLPVPLPPQAGVTLSGAARRAQDNLAALRRKVADFWILGVYDRSLEDYPLLDLDVETRPDFVEQPFAGSVQPVYTVEKSGLSNLVELYDRMHGSLLIVGEPGAGKTTALLALAKMLLQRAEQDPDSPIPVVFNLSSWRADKFSSFEAWLVQQFHLHYKIGAKLAAGWLAKNRLLLLLDGLDEVDAGERDSCVAAIDAYQQGRADVVSLVVCCRLAEYQALTRKLRLDGAVLLKTLRQDQIQAYLRERGPKLHTLAAVLARDPQLAEMVSSPLLLNILAVGCEDAPPELAQQALSVQLHRRRLFDLYVERMFARSVRTERPKYDRDSLLHCISWLAYNMDRRSLSLFAIEMLQPDWLVSSRVRWVYRAGVMLAAGGLFILFCMLGATAVAWLDGVLSGRPVAAPLDLLPPALAYGATWAGGMLLAALAANRLPWWAALSLTVLTLAAVFTLLFRQPLLGLLLGCIVGLPAGVAGLTLAHRLPIVFADKLRWSSRRALAGLAIGAGAGAAIAWATLTLAGYGPAVPLADVALVASLLGVVGMVAPALRGSEAVDMRVTPNAGFRRSAANALAAGAAVLLAILILVVLSGLLEDSLQSGLSMGVLLGLPISLTIALWAGGAACLRHAVLRLVLTRAGRVPLELAHYLEAGAERIFLRRVGGSYIFIHRLVLEHFAAAHAGQDAGDITASVVEPASVPG